MPTLTVKLPAEAPAGEEAALAAALTRITAEVLGKRAELTAVLIEWLPPAHWFIGGRPPGRPTAWLEIAITAGTNTAAEKAAFVARAHAELRYRLAPAGGELEPASYVIVREVAETDWGYGGQTQQARRHARERAAAAA